MGASTPAIAPPPGPPFVTHVDGGWLSIIGPDVTLTQADIGYQTPAGGVDVQGSLDVIVYADTVRVTSTLRNPGRKIVIIARDIAGAPGAIIDVSGPPGAPSYRQGDQPIQTNTNRGAAGASGAHGGPGGAAGSIALHVLAVTGPLALRATGGPGGRGQDGHNGELGTDGAWGTTPTWNGAMDGDAGQGGRGGDAGDGGPGGAGGHVTIGVVGGAPISAFGIDVSGGPGGDTGMPAMGGMGGLGAHPQPGQWRNGRNGPEGMPGNFNRRPNPGVLGAPGSPSVPPFTIADLAGMMTLPLLTMYQQQADAAFLRQDYATAARYYGLLLTATANASPTSENSDEQARAAIGQAARCELSRLRQGLDFFGDRPDWAPALTLGLLQTEITAMLTLTGQLETSLTTLADAQASADAKRAALQAAIDNGKTSLTSTQANLDSLTHQLKQFEVTLEQQAAAISGQFQAIGDLQAHLKADQFAHDHPGCSAMGALQTAGVVIVAAVALDSGVGEIVAAGESLYAAGTVMGGVKNGISLVTSIQSTIGDANKLFDALRGGYDTVKGKIDDNHPDGGKVFATEEQYDAFLQQYMGTYLEQDAVDIKAAVHRYFEMVKARNADVLSFNALYLKRERLQVELAQQTAQLELVASQLAAQNDPTNTAYITYLQAVDSQVRLYLLRKIEEERHAFLYWSLDNDGSSSPGPGGPTDSSLASLQAAHLGIAQGIDDWRESLGRAPGKFAVKATFTRKDNPLAFKAMETTRKLALTLDVDSGGAFFGPLTHVLAETVRLHLPDYDEKTQSSGSLQVNLIHGGTSSFVQLDGQTVVSFTHALRPIFYWYDYEQATISYDGTIGDDDQGYAGLSPFTNWVIDFTVGRGAANSFIDFSKVNSVALEFHGHSVGPNLKAKAGPRAAVAAAAR